MIGRVHVCRFDAVELPRGRRLTYATLKAAVLAAGRFSVFEATQNARVARLFDELARDPSIEMETVGYPWTRVRRREP